jgi:hypothetical protein
VRSPENRRTGTAGPGVIPLGTRTFTWFSAADPGALRNHSTSAIPFVPEPWDPRCADVTYYKKSLKEDTHVRSSRNGNQFNLNQEL